jgi:hypothetical protein
MVYCSSITAKKKQRTITINLRRMENSESYNSTRGRRLLTAPKKNAIKQSTKVQPWVATNCQNNTASYLGLTFHGNPCKYNESFEMNVTDSPEQQHQIKIPYVSKSSSSNSAKCMSLVCLCDDCITPSKPLKPEYKNQNST